jgi:hypothetical protein
MGPAANAGVKEATVIVAGLRANAVFHAMTKDSPNQEQLFAWLAKAIQDVMLDTGKATVAKVTADVNTEYVERIKSLNNRTETTMGKLEDASKLLLSGAEAKANIITRKREEAQARFVASLELVKTKVALINTLDGRLEIMSVDLEKVSADPKVELEDMYRRVGQIFGTDLLAHINARSNCDGKLSCVLEAHRGPCTATSDNGSIDKRSK